MGISVYILSIMNTTFISCLEGVSGEVGILPQNGSGHCMLPNGFSRDCHVCITGLMDYLMEGNAQY